MFRYPDPLQDHRAWEAELVRLEAQVPKCCECRSPVMEDYCFELNDDRIICAECLDNNHMVEIEDQALVCDHCGESIEDDYAYKNDDGEVFCKGCVVKHYRRRAEWQQ